MLSITQLHLLNILKQLIIKKVGALPAKITLNGAVFVKKNKRCALVLPGLYSVF